MNAPDTIIDALRDIACALREKASPAVSLPEDITGLFAEAMKRGEEAQQTLFSQAEEQRRFDAETRAKLYEWANEQTEHARAWEKSVEASLEAALRKVDERTEAWQRSTDERLNAWMRHMEQSFVERKLAKAFPEG